MTEEILDFMEQRRRMKSQPIDRYKDLDRLVKTMYKERKEEWLRERCQEMEHMERVDMRLMAEKIREITGQKRTTRSTIVKDRNGNILRERIDVLNRRREYVEGLYRDHRGEKPELDGCEPGPPILRNEMEKAVRGMKWRKAVRGRKWRKAEGSVWIVVKMVEAGGDFTIRKTTELANRIYETGVLPDSMRESEFIVIPKKVVAVDCEKHRTISITSQVAKIILKVIDERLKSKVEETTNEAQFGFRRRKGTRNAIFLLRMIMERAIEKQKDLYMCFVDFEKAFDRVRRELLIDRLRRIGAVEADVRLLTNLYWEQKAVVKIGDDRSDWIKIEKGVRQGCVLSPDVFSQ